MRKKKEIIAIDTVELAAFGERLLEARQQLRLKQKEMAPDLEVSASALSGLEKGKSKPSYDVLKRLYKRFNIDLHYLIDGMGDALINRELQTGLNLDDTTMEDEKIKELLYYMENAPMVKFAVLEFLSNYLFEKKNAIKEDMEKHRQFLQRVKKKQKAAKKKG
jgi:transcriptional regulator with XRE-family HTH domain